MVSLLQRFGLLRLSVQLFSTTNNPSLMPVCEYMHPELRLPLCIFYLVLRGLDTIEDDMSIPITTKVPLLRGFGDILDIDGWTFDGNRPSEKDRNLMLNFDNVISELKRLNPKYQLIIKGVADKMGKGMADFWEKGDTNAFRIESIHDYDLYCYDAAVSVGEGVSQMLIEAGFATSEVMKHDKSVALFFQRVNAIHDVKEDYDDNRQLWPREIWSKYVDTWDDLFKPANRQAALNCASEMVLDALEHAEGSILFCSGITERSAFTCTAMTVLKAVILLQLCLCDEALFCHEIPIPDQQKLELKSLLVSDCRQFYIMFRIHIQCIRRKADASSTQSHNISKVCEKIEKQIGDILTGH
ncbi:terpenoid synthase [Aspergillus saccharolyticus JOP 1030-1]|uniref:Terpenoid synthase n=1 Tax=Aspergillus saccharolyticus JOP 1030-1 TaxID=1450539 RepID=A0A318ZN05_9EURO|nr:terpenoid synthase [Aspergillus saccharolyticus JOP 1030-1]PYH48357.1 terpenoid synthase [Aspergillus saccharolyticus JOP 1030-1]